MWMRVILRFLRFTFYVSRYVRSSQSRRWSFHSRDSSAALSSVLFWPSGVLSWARRSPPVLCSTAGGIFRGIGVLAWRFDVGCASARWWRILVQLRQAFLSMSSSDKMQSPTHRKPSISGWNTAISRRSARTTIVNFRSARRRTTVEPLKKEWHPNGCHSIFILVNQSYY